MSQPIISGCNQKSYFSCSAWLICITVLAAVTTSLAERVHTEYLLHENDQDPSTTVQGGRSQASDHWLSAAALYSAEEDPFQLVTRSLASQQGDFAPIDVALLSSSSSPRQAAQRWRTAGRVAVQSKVAKYAESYGMDAVANLSQWRASLFRRTLDLQIRYQQALAAAKETQGALPNLKKDSLELWAPIVSCPPGMPIERVENTAAQDAAKWLCSVKNASPPCVIYSLGSNNDYSFEDHMLQTTACSIHTFDCTVAGAPRSRRNFYHNICIGKAPGDAVDKSMYMSLTEVQAMLGHSHVTIMKMDIEGFEYDALQDWKDTDDLPDQLLLEYHYGLPAKTAGARTIDTLGEMSLFMMHLANLGYAVMGGELNPGGAGCCAELGFLRVEAVQQAQMMGKRQRFNCA